MTDTPAAFIDEHPVLNHHHNHRDVDGSQPAPPQEQEEDVLRDVLNELDRERTRRAELEAQIRVMTDEHDALVESLQAAHIQLKEQEKTIDQLKKEASSRNETLQMESTNKPPLPVDTEQSISNRAFMAMELQVKEFQALVDELTKGKPAIAAAASNRSTKERSNIPLYVIRLLEILPWTPHAHEHVFARQEIFEWQYYDNRERRWISNLRIFPQHFKALPVVRPKRGQEMGEKDRGLLIFLAGGSKNNPAAPSKHGVLTDELMTHVLSIEEGYPLPEDGGTWEWIGGWRIEKRVSTQLPQSALKHKVDCDEEGWSYAKEPDSFKINPTEWVWDNPGEAMKIDGKSTDFQRKLRRRKWTRQRVLVDYPYACESTKQYLKLLAENARLTVTTNKISDQLVETKTALTENEEVLMREKSEAQAELARLTRDLQLRNRLLHEAGTEIADDSTNRPRSGSFSNNPIHDFIVKNEQMKGLGNKISQWVKAGRHSGDGGSHSHMEDNLASISSSTADETTVASPDSTTENGSPRGFDWKKVGRNTFDKLKGSDKSASKSTRAVVKLVEPSQQSEGSMTDESVDDVMDIQEQRV